MNTRHLFFLTSAALLLIAVLFSGCRHDVPEYVFLNDTSAFVSSFKVVSESDLNLSDDGVWDNTLSELDGGEDTKATYTNLILAVSGVVSSAISPKVHQVVGTYRSTDINGDTIVVSGKIVYPTKCKPRNLMIVSHYTIGSNVECPSVGFSFESIYAALGYIVVIADYIGFGQTVNRIHPYLQAETTARNVIDMAIAAKPFLTARGVIPESDEVILLGYSQGGATTMHVQRLLETYPEYMNLFKIKKNYAGSGPYNIARTYDYSIKVDKTGIPCAVPMIIQGMSIGMSKPLDMDYFFQEPLRSNYSEWLNSKKYTVKQISTLIGSDNLSDILTPEAADKSKPETARFYLELLRNSIPSDYCPDAPIYMFHSEDDQTVPFVNSQLMQRQFQKYFFDGAEYDFDHYGNHQQGATKFILKVAGFLK